MPDTSFAPFGHVKCKKLLGNIGVLVFSNFPCANSDLVSTALELVNLTMFLGARALIPIFLSQVSGLISFFGGGERKRERERDYS
jgi:hypothetical protein